MYIYIYIHNLFIWEVWDILLSEPMACGWSSPLRKCVQLRFRGKKHGLWSLITYLSRIKVETLFSLIIPRDNLWLMTPVSPFPQFPTSLDDLDIWVDGQSMSINLNHHIWWYQYQSSISITSINQCESGWLILILISPYHHITISTGAFTLW